MNEHAGKSSQDCQSEQPADSSQLDREICLCFHVTRRKLLNFLRLEKPRRAAQMSDCFGAGTGCGWCRPYLQQLFEAAASQGKLEVDLPSPADYAQMRSKYQGEKEGR